MRLSHTPDCPPCRALHPRIHTHTHDGRSLAAAHDQVHAARGDGRTPYTFLCALGHAASSPPTPWRRQVGTAACPATPSSPAATVQHATPRTPRQALFRHTHRTDARSLAASHQQALETRDDAPRDALQAQGALWHPRRSRRRGGSGSGGNLCGAVVHGRGSNRHTVHRNNAAARTAPVSKRVARLA